MPILNKAALAPPAVPVLRDVSAEYATLKDRRTELMATLAASQSEKLDPRTQYVRRVILEKLCDKHGERPYAGLEPRHIRAWRDARVATPEAANGIIKALRQVLSMP